MNIVLFSSEMQRLCNAAKMIAGTNRLTNNAGFKIIADNDGMTIRLACSGFNNSVFLLMNTTGTVIEPGEIDVPLMFADIVAKQNGDLSISDAGNSVTISSGSGKKKSISRVSKIGDYSLNIPDAKDDPVFVSKSKTLTDTISSIQYAISTDEGRMVLTGANLEVSGEGARITALDGFRLNSTAVDGEVKPGKEACGIIPGKTLSVAEKLFKMICDSDTDVAVSLGDGRFAFKTEEFVFSGGLLAGEYIDYKRIVPVSFEKQAKVNKSALMDALSRANVVIAGQRQSYLTISFDEGTAVISSRSEVADVREEVDCEYTGNEPFAINFNAQYLNDSIKAVKGDSVTIKLNSSVKPAVFCSDEQDTSINLVLPVRTFNTNVAAG